MAKNEKNKKKKKTIFYNIKERGKQILEMLRLIFIGKQRIYGAVTLAFLTVLLASSIGNAVVKDKVYSTLENREPEQKPAFTVVDFFTGTWMRKTEEYQREQIWGRDNLLQIQSGIGQFFGKSLNEGVWKGKHQYLLEVPTVPSETQKKALYEELEKLGKENTAGKNYLLVVPEAADIWSDKIPTLAKGADQSTFFEETKEQLNSTYTWIDALSVLEEKKEEDLYYHTDSRLTGLGAKEVSEAIQKSMGLKGNYEYTEYAVANDFNGNLSEKSKFLAGYKEPMYVYLSEEEPDYIVNYIYENAKTTTVYARKRLEEKGKYQVFLDGDHALVDIQTTSDSQKKIMILKDSYANAIIPFLVPYFREIIVVDTDLYEGNLGELASKYEVSDWLLIYGANHFGNLGAGTWQIK